MSAHSFPSLISDSSSLSRSADFNEFTPERLSIASLTTKPTASIPLPPRKSESPEVLQLRSKVSKLEQDRLMLGGYAAELQSRIRGLEFERMEPQDPITNREELGPIGQAENIVSTPVPLSLSRRTSLAMDTYSVAPHHSSLYRPSNSLSAATSSAAKRAIGRTSPHGTPYPTSSRIAVPASTGTKLVSKPITCTDAPEIIVSTESESPVGLRRCETDSMTPTRRRLQAIFSSESSPSLDDSGPNQSGRNGYKPSEPQRARSLRIPYFQGSGQDNARNQETKRTTFTSKLDSIILTSKLFPLPSSRAKAHHTPISLDQHAPTSHTAVIPLAHATTSSTPHKGTVLLDSPPSKHVKVQLPENGHGLLSRSSGLEENRRSGLTAKSTDQTVVPKRPGRVSFSERLFFSSTDRGDEQQTNVEHTKGMWGSWSGRRGRPAPLSFIKEKSISSQPSTPRSAFSYRGSKSQGEPSGDADVQRRRKRASLAPGCLRTLVSGSGDRNKPPLEDQRDRFAVLRRTHSETGRSGVESRSHSVPRSRQPEDVDQSAKGKDDKKRITPSRVGSPMLQGRLPEFQGGTELERSCSVKSTGKLDRRGRGVSTELTRRRTIHPMFSFERPGSIEAASMSSSKRGENADDEVMGGHERRRASDRSQRLPRRAASPASEPARLPPHDFDAPQSPATHTQDPSQASGHSGGTAPLTRPEPGPVDRAPMMRTRLGMQSHGTFAFEPAAAVVCSPRSTPIVGGHVRSVDPTGGSLSKAKGAGLARSLSISDGRARHQVGSKKDRAADKELEYLEFCNELKFVLGDGEDWSSFKKYVRRFDLEVVSAEVLLQRVKKLLDSHRSVDGATKVRLYERFVEIVHDSLNE